MGFMEEETETEEPEEEETEEQSSDEEIDLSSLAPNAMDIDEAIDEERTWKILVWSEPAQGKTHFGYTAPEPVCFIDTENKAADIAHKFSDKVVQIWTPDNFDEAEEALDEALSFLSEYKAKAGDTGTIVVDSMSDMWQWSQYKYIDKYYGNTDPEDVSLDLNDWGPIKKIHNERFRKKMEDCDFNLVWTATRKDDVKAAMENDLSETPDKPGGETSNVYKVNHIIRLYLNEEGIPVGDHQKSGLTRFKYLGMKRPTFDKHKEVVEEVESIEMDGAETAQEVAQDFNLDYQIAFTEANTLKLIDQE